MNYVLEGDTNFNEILHSMICKEEETSDLCLIGGEKLATDPVILQCGHRFNYPNILSEVKVQKKYTALEVCRVGRYEIKCPYCRRIHSGVLPYRPQYETAKLVGINWPPCKILRGYKCTSLLKSGKRAGEQCGQACVEKHCPRHLHYIKNIDNKKIKAGNIKVGGTAVRCQVLLRYGNRKGSKCLAKCISMAAGTCRRHLAKKDNK